MSFTRVGPFSLGGTLTSTQLNTIDLNVSHAVDKTTAGDTLSGLLGMASTAAIVAGISAGSQGMSGAMTSGSLGFGYCPSTTQPVLASGVSAGILSTVAGAFGLGGGAADWPTFVSVSAGAAPVASPRGRLLMQAFTAQAAGWNIESFTGNLVATGIGGTIQMPITSLHHGATLTSVAVLFFVGSSHSSVPANLPTVYVYRISTLPTIGGAPPARQALSGTDPSIFPTPGTGGAYYDSGNVQSWNYVCNENNVIDRENYNYFVYIEDESGSGSIDSNQYIGISLNFSSIPNLQFP
jgi:hypothetical protein